ncbi:MAG: RDD family protein [Mariprofundales bacterium]
MANAARSQATAAGLIYRLLAAGYDFLILFALEFLVFIPLTMVKQTMGEIPQWLEGILVLTVAWAYFTGFWQRGGATTGMRPWKLRLAMVESGDPPTALACAVRFVVLMLTWGTLGGTILMVLTGHTHNPVYALLALLPLVSMVCLMVSERRQPLHDWMAGTNIYRIME